MSLLARVLRVVLNALQGFAASLRWLARQAYRQRSLGVMASPDLARLLDLHFATVAANLALIAALIVARPAPTLQDWLLTLPLLAVLTAGGVWRAGRARLAVLVVLQLITLVMAVVISRQPIMLAMLVAMAVAQHASLVTAWVHLGKGPGLGRATAAGLLLGVLTGGGGLLLGLLTPAFPLATCIALFVIGLTLVWRMPGPQRPEVPQQPAGAPEGYAIYRPSSLDEPSS
jgi:hypothetical protein